MNAAYSKTGKQRGFGLVELMIAITLGLLLILGVGYLYIGSRGAFRTSDNLSRMQENARYALNVLSSDIRQAGYVGCGNMASVVVTTLPPVPAMNALQGYDDGAGWVNPTTIARPAGDVLSVMAAFSNGVNLANFVKPSSPSITIAPHPPNPDKLKKDDVLVVSNCANADVFKVTSNPDTLTLTHAGTRAGTYAPDAFVMRFDRRTYFIGINPAGNRSLYRVGLNGKPEELVEHVQDMQFVYGLDTNADGDNVVNRVDSYSTTPGDWTQVVSVRVNLLMRSPEDSIATAPQSVVFNNGTFNANALDRHLYQVFSATVSVRNRLPAS